MDVEYIIFVIYYSVDVPVPNHHDLIRKKFQKVRKLQSVSSAMSYMNAGAVKIPETKIHITHSANVSVLESFLTGTAENLKNTENYEVYFQLQQLLGL